MSNNTPLVLSFFKHNNIFFTLSTFHGDFTIVMLLVMFFRASCCNSYTLSNNSTFLGLFPLYVSIIQQVRSDYIFVIYATTFAVTVRIKSILMQYIKLIHIYFNKLPRFWEFWTIETKCAI